MECPRCQMANPEGARFCLNCGERLEAQTRVDGERKHVTVLFADVVDSTGLGERLDPEQVAEIMNGAFAFLNASVKRYDGTVARLLGDAIIAFFGAPVAHEDDAERAVRAGLDIQAAAREYAESVRRNYGVDFGVRVGINTGLAVLAAVGDEIRAEYTALGDTTNVAARMQSALDYYRRNGMKPYLAGALQSLARWHEQQGQAAQAGQARAEALRLMEELSLPPLGSSGGGPLATDEPRPDGQADR